MKQIKGFENYTIDTDGNIYSSYRQSFGKPKATKINNKGYVMVSLYKDKKECMKYLHRLMAENFIDNTNNLPEVNHKDGNKLNNTLDNLEWCTKSYNKKHSRRVLRNNLNPITIYEDGNKKEFDFMIDCSEYLKMKNATLSNILHGYRKKPKEIQNIIFIYKGEKI